MRYVALAGLALLGCSSSSSTSSTTLKANPCATRGATYVEHFQQQSGNCGPQSDAVYNISPDGTIGGTNGGSSGGCESSTLDGCTARNSNCQSTTSNGITCESTSDTTISQDGATISGIISLNCNDGHGGSCTGTYAVSGRRQ